MRRRGWGARRGLLRFRLGQRPSLSEGGGYAEAGALRRQKNAYVELVVDELRLPEDEESGRRRGAAAEPEAERGRGLAQPQPVPRVGLGEGARGAAEGRAEEGEGGGGQTRAEQGVLNLSQQTTGKCAGQKR